MVMMSKVLNTGPLPPKRPRQKRIGSHRYCFYMF